MKSYGLCLVLLLTFVTEAAAAQTSADGSIRGYVTDEQKAIMPGVTITATNPSVPVPHTAVTDADGYYRLLNLPPAEYTLTAELQGFAKFVREPIVVRAGLNLSVDIVMKVGAVTEILTVKVDTPMLEVSRAVQAVNIDGDFQRALPITVRRNWSDFMVMTPGVVHTDDPGQSYFFAVHGASIDSNIVQLDGADVLSAGQSSNLYLSLNDETIKDVQVKTAGVDASSPLALGAVVNIATQSGTNRFKGTIAGILQRKGWSADNNPGGTTTAIRTWQPDLSLGGPFRRDHWWFFGSYRFSQDSINVGRRADQIADLEALVPGFRPFNRDGDDHYVFFKTTAQISASHQVYAFYQYDDLVNGTVGSTFGEKLGSIHIGGTAVAARLSSVWGSSLTTRMLVTFNNKAFVSYPIRFDRPSVVVHRGVFVSSGQLVGTGGIATLDNLTSKAAIPTRKLIVSADATYYRRGWLGTHEFQAGLYFLPVNNVKVTTDYVNGGFALEDRVLRNTSNPTAGMMPFHRLIYDTDSIVTTDTDNPDYAFYVQDAWKPTSRLTLSGGVRVDWIRRSDEIFDVVLQETTAVGPRLGVNYLLTADRRNAIRANWGRVHETPARGTRSTAGTVQAGRRDLYDFDGDGTFETVFVTPATNSLTLNRQIDLDGYKQPRVDEWVVGYARQFPGQITFDASVIRREFRDRVANVEVNGVYVGNMFAGYRDESFNDIVRLTSNVWNRPVFTGLEFQAAQRGARHQLLASYVRAFQHLAGTWVPNDPALFIQPAAFPNNRGAGATATSGTNSLSGTDSTSADGWRDHRVSLAASVELPWNLQAATSFQYQSGVWSGPIVTRIAAADPQFGPPTVRLSNGRVVPNPLATTIRFAFPTRGDGQIKTPSMKMWNLRLNRAFTLGRARVDGGVHVINLLNDDADQLFDSGATQLYNPNYGKGRWRLHPRALQLSARFVL